MSLQTVVLGLKGIHGAEGYQEATKALTTIEGVSNIEIQPEQNRVLVSFDDTKTSIHAFKAALTTVDYITEPFPIDAPANPNNDRTLLGDLEQDGRL